SAVPNSSGIWNRRDEPDWNSSRTLITLCTMIGCSNLADITAAFSSGSRVLLDLPAFRNFYGHRNEQTQSAAMQLASHYGISATMRPSTILLTRGLGRGLPLIVDWIDDLDFTIEYLCS